MLYTLFSFFIFVKKLLKVENKIPLKFLGYNSIESTLLNDWIYLREDGFNSDWYNSKEVILSCEHTERQRQWQRLRRGPMDLYYTEHTKHQRYNGSGTDFEASP